MNQEEKQILLKDLSARLPYGVMVNVKGFDFDFNSKLVQIYKGVGCSVEVTNGMPYDIDEIKPYLFPLSSISNEIIDEIYSNTGVYDIDVDSPVNIEVGTTFENLTKIFDILHKHHIDYQNLIQKGLAIDATGLNIY